MTKPNQSEKAMVDLSGFTPDELQRLVGEEMARRKYAAVSELKAVAEKYGYSLSDLTAPRGAVGRPKGSKATRPYGALSQIIASDLRAGKNVNEIAQAVGWKSAKNVYSYARRLGIQMMNGRAVL